MLRLNRLLGASPDRPLWSAVSKVQPDTRVLTVLDAGHRVFGENYVQEAQGKWPDWRERYDGVELHMIGPLQSNKAKSAVQLFDAIHTLDRISLARNWQRRSGYKTAARNFLSRLIPEMNLRKQVSRRAICRIF